MCDWIATVGLLPQIVLRKLALVEAVMQC